MKVSILLSTFNGERFLEKTLRGIAGQSHRDFEVLAIDDASSDGTPQILREWARQDGRFKVTPDSENRGIGFRHRQLLKEARGELIALIGHDDVWEPSFLADSIAALRENPGAVAVFADCEIIDGDDRVQSPVSDPFRPSRLKGLSHLEQLEALFEGNFLCASSSCFYRRYIEGWSTLGDVDQLQDWATWLHLSLQGPLAYLPRKLTSYRRHGSNLSLQNANPAQLEREAAFCRFQILSSPLLAQALAGNGRALARLIEIFRCEHASPALRVLLECALRQQAGAFEDLPQFHHAVSLALHEGGSFRHAAREWRKGDQVLEQQDSKWLVRIGPPFCPSNAGTPPNPWLKAWSFGWLQVVQIRLSNPLLNAMLFKISRRSERLEQAAESAVVKALYGKKRKPER